MHTCPRNTSISLELIEAVHGRSLGKGAVICTRLREINTFLHKLADLRLKHALQLRAYCWNRSCLIAFLATRKNDATEHDLSGGSPGDIFLAHVFEKYKHFASHLKQACNGNRSWQSGIVEKPLVLRLFTSAPAPSAIPPQVGGENQRLFKGQRRFYR